MELRNDLWLKSEMDKIWKSHFADIRRENEIVIRFGRKAKARLGSIKMSRDKKVSFITINGLCKDFFVPKKVILAIIAHELVHYVHGFCSPLPQQFKYPHKGGCVKKELIARGLKDLHLFEKNWLKEHWRNFAECRLN